MKKTILFFTTLLVSHIAVYATGSDSLAALDILYKVQDKIRQIKTLSYSSAYRQVNSEMADSVYTSEGTVWLAMQSSDSIFGYRFHIKGLDKNDNPFDSYYDGDKSYEIRYAGKEVTIIYPANFLNNANNPAKTRTALLPLLKLFTDSAVVQTLLGEQPSLGISETGNAWKITLGYPANKYGALTTMELMVNRQTFCIESVGRKTLWNGTHYQSMYRISNIKINDNGITDSIVMTQPPADFAVKEIKTAGKVDYDAIPRSFIGKKAPSFDYVSTTGKKITLPRIKAKYILLDFWESWCGYCILAIPKMEELYKQYHSKGLEIVGVTTENIEQIKQIIQRNQLGYPTLVADKKILADYKVDARPTYVLIKSDGTIESYILGDLDKMIQAIKKGLGE